MKLIIAGLSLCLMATATFAQSANRPIYRLSEQVNELVYNHADDIQRQDLREVRRSLRAIKSMFAEYGYYPSDDGSNTPEPRRLFCDTGDNTLRDLTTGELIHDFGNTSNCHEALEYVKNFEPFCDYGDNTLRTSYPKVTLVHDFGNSADCKVARVAVINEKPFCDFGNNALYTHEGVLIHDFSSRRDCEKARDNW